VLLEILPKINVIYVVIVATVGVHSLGMCLGTREPGLGSFGLPTGVSVINRHSTHVHDTVYDVAKIHVQ